MTPIAQRLRRTGGALLAIVAIVFVAEMAVMGGLALAGVLTWQPQVAILDGLILALVIAGPIYALMLLPLHREHDKRLAIERRARELDRLAMSDPLTGVLNRRGILSRLLEAMAHAERYDRQLSVAMLDLDRFKEVNDRHGHSLGDEVLRRVAGRFAAALRASDLIGRLGGDEFLVVLPETELELALAWADRVRRRMDRSAIQVGSERVRLGVSIGVCEAVADERLRELLERVDAALYRAKEIGRRTRAGAVASSAARQPGAPSHPSSPSRERAAGSSA